VFPEVVVIFEANSSERTSLESRALQNRKTEDFFILKQ